MHLPIHVLLIEDDEVDVEFMQRGFRGQDQQLLLTVVSGGREALQVLRC